ncbi:hypothetical protein DL764_010798 [Monosporascus ibericus]|uniref:Succinate-semialdehyde dehydrogenase, mitochondrial n=1 Tax=Monosporascus ibericus TaxID=155417 RepID=A0A4Q4SS29_9PEZI|nr:hypothetical protein DL764_010798 [Monosporascus ibericus]
MAEPLALPRLEDLSPEYVAHDEGRVIYGSMAAMTGLATTIVVLRLWARKARGAAIELDDWLILASLPFLWALTVCGVLAVVLGGVGKHLIVNLIVDPDSLERGAKCFFIAQFMYGTVIALIKWSILALYRRIFPTQFMKTSCSILGGLVFAWCKLKLRTIQKAAITGIFLLGGVATIASCIRLKVIYVMWENISTVDVTIEIKDSWLWSVTEPAVGVLCACLPTLRPLVVAIMGTVKRYSTKRSTAESNNIITTGGRASKPTSRPRFSTGHEGQSIGSFERLNDIESAEGDTAGLVLWPRGFCQDRKTTVVGQDSHSALSDEIALGAIHVRNEPRSVEQPTMLGHHTPVDTSRVPAVRSSFQRTTLPLVMSRLASNKVPKLKDPSLLKTGVCYVNGEWIKASSGKTFEVHDPSTGELIGSCPEFDVKDTEKAIAAAAAAFDNFRTKTGREKSKLLRRWYDLTVENAEDLATLITWENGKPLTDAKGEVTYAANFFEWFSEEAPRVYGDTIPATVPGNRVLTIKEPVGVCGLITPWNFPAAMITRKIGPALAAGCTTVCKAPGETPFTSLALAELAHRAGIPKGVVNVITGLENTPAIGETLTTHPTIRKVSFTGSTGVGKILMRQASSTLKILSMELGGNAPLIVFDDADVDLAVTGAVASKFRSSGQTCVCANRIYVQKGIYDEFAQKFAEKVKEFKVGHGFDEGVTHGPLIHGRAVSKVDAHVKDAEKKGGKVIMGGRKIPDLGSNFYQPTVITGMTKDMDIACEETFGPVAGLFPFESEQEVVELANAAEVGLAGYFFSRDLQRITRVAEALEVGMIGVNTGLISDPAAPFGGVKQSGFGREGSKYGIEEYLNIKTLTFGGMGKALQS